MSAVVQGKKIFCESRRVLDRKCMPLFVSFHRDICDRKNFSAVRHNVSVEKRFCTVTVVNIIIFEMALNKLLREINVVNRRPFEISRKKVLRVHDENERVKNWK